jgi:hypothetical protein
MSQSGHETVTVTARPVGEPRGTPSDSQSDGGEAAVQIIEQRRHCRRPRAAHRRHQGTLPLQRRACQRAALPRRRVTLSAMPPTPIPATEVRGVAWAQGRGHKEGTTWRMATSSTTPWPRG